MEWFDRIPGLAMDWGVRLFWAGAIFFIGRMVATAVKGIVKRVLEKAGVEAILTQFVKVLAYWAVMIFVVVASLNQLGIHTTSFVAVLGAAGLAIGLAFKDSLSNFASGMMAVIFRPFKIGDFIEGGGSAGIVEKLTLFTTHLRTPDNKAIIMPNSKLMADNITNITAKETRRVDLVMGIGYQDDIDLAKETISRLIDADARILKDPAPFIGVVELADSSVNIAVRPWVQRDDYFKVLVHLNEGIKKAFDAAGISIPYPQQDVHLFQADKEPS